MPNVPHLVDETTGAAINLPVANYLTSDLRAPAAPSKPAVYDQHVFTRVRIPGEDEVDREREVDARARPDWAKILAE